jgi:nucleolar protein 56
MKVSVVKTPIGLFAFSENNDLVFYKIFPADPAKALGEFEGPQKDFSAALKGHERVDSKKSVIFLRKHFREYALSLGFADSDEKLNSFLNGFALLLSRKGMKKQLARDRLLIQASSALEDVIRIENLVTERFREWFALHYPELKNVTAEMVIKYGGRKNFPGFRESVGVDLTESDLEIIKKQAASLKTIQDYRKDLEKYIRETTKDVMPNFSSLIDPILASRFLALAGSLEKLAKMPASSIQLLGAEKALFRHLREKGKSPKYGILFLDPRVHTASEQQKGRIARVISSKLMQAVRIDYYSGRDESERLRNEMNEEIKKVRG